MEAGGSRWKQVEAGGCTSTEHCRLTLPRDFCTFSLLSLYSRSTLALLSLYSLSTLSLLSLYSLSTLSLYFLSTFSLLSLSAMEALMRCFCWRDSTTKWFKAMLRMPWGIWVSEVVWLWWCGCVGGCGLRTDVSVFSHRVFPSFFFRSLFFRSLFFRSLFFLLPNQLGRRRTKNELVFFSLNCCNCCIRCLPTSVPTP